MQLKTIKKVIKAALEEWLATITDPVLQEQVKDKIIVSGGCIANMLLGQEVNDYDLYFTDKEVLAKLAEYYTKPYKEDVEVWRGWLKEDHLKGLEKQYQNLPADEIHGIRAVAMKNLHEDQVKLFFLSKAGGLRIDDAEEDKKRFMPAFFSANAISLTDKIQIVLRFTGSPEEIHKNFDFIHATNYFTFKDGIVTNLKAVESLLTKQLSYQGSLYPLTSIIRVRKFQKRGWNIGAGELLKIMFQISELDLTDPDVLEEQLIGVYVAYFDQLVKILRNAHPEGGITSPYLNTIIDRVFNESDTED